MITQKQLERNLGGFFADIWAFIIGSKGPVVKNVKYKRYTKFRYARRERETYSLSLLPPFVVEEIIYEIKLQFYDCLLGQWVWDENRGMRGVLTMAEWGELEFEENETLKKSQNE